MELRLDENYQLLETPQIIQSLEDLEQFVKYCSKECGGCSANGYFEVDGEGAIVDIQYLRGRLKERKITPTNYSDRSVITHKYIYDCYFMLKGAEETVHSDYKLVGGLYVTVERALKAITNNKTK